MARLAVKPVVQEEEYENLLLKNDSRMRISERMSLPEGMPEIMQILEEDTKYMKYLEEYRK